MMLERIEARDPWLTLGPIPAQLFGKKNAKAIIIPLLQFQVILSSIWSTKTVKFYIERNWQNFHHVLKIRWFFI